MSEKIGSILIQRGLITPQQLDEALANQLGFNTRLGTVLVQLGYLQLDDLARALSTQHGVALATPEMLERTQPEALQLVTTELADRLKVVPMSLEGETLHVAMLSPLRGAAGELSFALKKTIQRYVAPELRIMYYLEKLFDLQRDPRYLRLPIGLPGVKPPPAAAAGQAGPAQPDPGERRRDAPVTIDVSSYPPPPSPSQTGEHIGLLFLDEAVLEELPEEELQEMAEEVVEPPAAPGARPPLAMPPIPPQTGKPPAARPRGLKTPPLGTPAAEPAAPATTPAGPAPAAPPATPQGVQASRLVDVLVEKLSTITSGNHVAKLLLEPSLEHLEVSLLLWIRQDHAVGFMVRGASLPNEQLGKLVISLQDPSLLKLALEKKAVLSAEGSADPVMQQIAAFIGAPVPKEFCVAPVVMRSKVSNLLCLLSQPDQGFAASAKDEVRLLVETASATYRRLLGAPRS